MEYVNYWGSPISVSYTLLFLRLHATCSRLPWDLAVGVTLRRLWGECNLTSMGHGTCWRCWSVVISFHLEMEDVNSLYSHEGSFCCVLVLLLLNEVWFYLFSQMIWPLSINCGICEDCFHASPFPLPLAWCSPPFSGKEPMLHLHTSVNELRDGLTPSHTSHASQVASTDSLLA